MKKISSAVKIMAQTVFPKKLFTSRKARTGRKAASEPTSVFHAYDNPSKPPPVVPYQTLNHFFLNVEVTAWREV